MVPQTLVNNGTNHVRLTFDLGQAADVTICVLGSDGTVLRVLSQPGLAAGWHSPWYQGHDNAGGLLPDGTYPILIVASNAQGSATAETVLTVTGQ
jgi:flagellar hook assembly protein FlgD